MRLLAFIILLQLSFFTPLYAQQDTGNKRMPAPIAPSYTKGHDALLNFIHNNLKVPKSLNKTTIVRVDFTVTLNGTLKGIKVYKSVAKNLEKEAIRVIALTSGYWRPAMVWNKNQEVGTFLEIEFKK